MHRHGLLEGRLQRRGGEGVGAKQDHGLQVAPGQVVQGLLAAFHAQAAGVGGQGGAFASDAEHLAEVVHCADFGWFGPLSLWGQCC